MASSLKQALKRARDKLVSPLVPTITPMNYFNAGATQIALLREYERRAKDGVATDFRSTGFRAYSESDDDGILIYIFGTIGMKHRSAVEISCGIGYQSISANLILNHSWDALLFDFDDRVLKACRDFYAQCVDVSSARPTIAKAWITSDNVNDQIASNGYQGDIDLLVLDVNGVDYWLLEAIDVVKPRVMCIEDNIFVPDDLAVTIPNDPDFWRFDRSPYYFGASIAAMIGLADRKGYRLVAVNRFRHNLFFVRKEEAGSFPKVSITDVPPRAPILADRQRIWPTIKDFPWQEVEAAGSAHQRATRRR